MERPRKIGQRRPERRPGTPVQLRVTAEDYRRMRERASAEGLAFAAWLRRCAFKELRRAPSI